MSKRKIRFDRLLKLAGLLDKVPAHSFDLSTWVQSGQTRPEGDELGDCGFAGCAVGWAAHAKLFPGFRLATGGRSPTYRGADNWEAVNKVFGFGATDILGNETSYEDAQYLFSDESYPSRSRWYYGKTRPKTVADRIRKFVADKKAGR